MVYVAASYGYDEDNDFLLREIYVSDDEIMFVLKSDEAYIPHKYEGSVLDLVEAQSQSVYPLLDFSPIRVHPDDDPKSLAMFFHSKINKVDLNHDSVDKALFNVISSFGEEYA